MDREWKKVEAEDEEEEEEKKDQAGFPQSKRGKNNIHSRVTITTAHHPQHDALGRTTN